MQYTYLLHVSPKSQRVLSGLDGATDESLASYAGYEEYSSIIISLLGDNDDRLWNTGIPETFVR